MAVFQKTWLHPGLLPVHSFCLDSDEMLTIFQSSMMERWVKVVLGTLLGCVASFVFYLVFEKLLQERRRKRERESETSHRASGIAMRVKAKVSATLHDDKRQEEVKAPEPDPVQYPPLPDGEASVRGV